MRISLFRSLFAFALAPGERGCKCEGEQRTEERNTHEGSLPSPSTDTSLAKSSSKQTAVFAGGCFWGTQAVFERVKGVIATTVGYSGGSKSTATYDQVITETTGHAESVE